MERPLLIKLIIVGLVVLILVFFSLRRNPGKPENSYSIDFTWGISEAELETHNPYEGNALLESVEQIEHYFLKENGKLCSATVYFFSDNNETNEEREDREEREEREDREEREEREEKKLKKFNLKNFADIEKKLKADYGEPEKKEYTFGPVHYTIFDRETETTKIRHVLSIQSEDGKETIVHKIHYIGKSYEKQYRKELGVKEGEEML